MNLIVCCTPLQMLIAEKIIDLYPNEKFVGVLLTNEKNEKYDFYFNRLKAKCHKTFWVKELDNFSYWEYLSYWFKWKMRFLCMSVEKIFFANVEKYFMRMLCQTLPKADIYTFDDGIRNLISDKDHIFTTYTCFRFRGLNLISERLGITYLGDSIKKRIKCHYSIYKNIDNIIEKTQLLSLINDNGEKNRVDEEIKLFIGQSINDYSDPDIDIALTEKMIKDYNISYYLPHPRESYKIRGVEYIRTPLIFEDYFAQYLRDKKVHIYTYFSSSAMNVASQDNVKITALKPNVITNKDFL